MQEQRVCGICSITLARRFPGVVGFDHPNEVNPDRYEAAKEQRIALKYMEHEPVGSPNHIDSRTARRWERMFVQQAERVEAQMKATPESYSRTMAEIKQSEEQAKKDDEARRLAPAMERLKAVDERVRMHGLAD
jgi:hypothetical protein